jgi:predicted Na+-dependent transporter
LLPVDAQVREGVLLCALAPGGASATLIAARMRADAAVAAAVVIAMTATSVVLTPLLVAAVLGGGDASTMFAVAGRAGLTALAYQALPLALGVLLGRRHPGFAARLLPWTSRTANAALAILVVGLLATRSAERGWRGGPRCNLCPWARSRAEVLVYASKGWRHDHASTHSGHRVDIPAFASGCAVCVLPPALG